MIMGNASFHHSERIRQMRCNAGVNPRTDNVTGNPCSGGFTFVLCGYELSFGSCNSGNFPITQPTPEATIFAPYMTHEYRITCNLLISMHYIVQHSRRNA
jgi:hypothetical protein